MDHKNSIRIAGEVKRLLELPAGVFAFELWSHNEEPDVDKYMVLIVKCADPLAREVKEKIKIGGQVSAVGKLFRSGNGLLVSADKVEFRWTS